MNDDCTHLWQHWEDEEGDHGSVCRRCGAERHAYYIHDDEGEEE